MCTRPLVTVFFSFFLKAFFFPGFTGAFAIESPETVSLPCCLCRQDQAEESLVLRLGGGFLLLRNGALARPFARAGVGMGSLPPDRQVTAVAQSPVGPDLNQPANVQGQFLPQFALDIAFFFQNLADSAYLVLIHIPHLGVRSEEHTS